MRIKWFETGMSPWIVALVVGMLVVTGGQAEAAQAGGLPALEKRVKALEEANVALQAALNEALEAIDAVQDLTQHLSLVDVDTAITDVLGNSEETLRISGVNLQVVNDTGTTADLPDGLGNVIIGYNELRGGGDDLRTGSHMLVVGREHNYSSFGGIVVGKENTTSGDFSSVSGGRLNEASGLFSSVSGGFENEASGVLSSVSGGQSNEASGNSSSVIGDAGKVFVDNTQTH